MEVISSESGLILDANVLIDYLSGDRDLISMISNCFLFVSVPSPIIFDELDEEQYISLAESGLEILEPTMAQSNEASLKVGSLSFYDHLCLILARERKLSCVSNDKPLRRECSGEGIPVFWGLEPLTVLVAQRILTVEQASRIAWAIHESNPCYIPESIVRRFERRIGIGL